jgi:hypothetical protein
MLDTAPRPPRLPASSWCIGFGNGRFSRSSEPRFMGSAQPIHDFVICEFLKRLYDSEVARQGKGAATQK